MEPGPQGQSVTPKKLVLASKGDFLVEKNGLGGVEKPCYGEITRRATEVLGKNFHSDPAIGAQGVDKIAGRRKTFPISGGPRVCTGNIEFREVSSSLVRGNFRIWQVDVLTRMFNGDGRRCIFRASFRLPCF